MHKKMLHTVAARAVVTAVVGGAILAGTLITAPSAEAEVVCTARGKILEALKRSYAEQPVALGLASNGGVMELLASEDGETWTLILTMPNGKTCVMASGESWMKVPKRVGEQAS